MQTLQSKRNRILKLAKVLKLTPTGKTRLEKDLSSQIWWILGCVEGEQPLPGTRGCATMIEALENVEGWLAPEFDAMDKS
jgi:hypothetical protein